MPSFSTKSTDQRLIETAEFITKQNRQAGLKVYEWGVDAPLHEFRRIGEKMHMGSSGTKEERRYRRAIIMMRAGVLRHDVNKAVNETKAILASQCQAKFNTTLLQCANYSAQVPSALDLMASQRGAKVEVDQATRLQGQLRGIQNSRKGLAHEIYIPVNDPNDGAIQHTYSYVKSNLCDDQYRTAIGPGKSLRALDNGGELFVIGHGNLGTGIGTHTREYGARDLVTQLRNDSLSRNPTAPVVIYLFACWAGTHTRRGFGGFGKREPYVRRFARALAANGFNNYQVVGFAGSVSKQTLTQDYLHAPGSTNPGTSSLGSDGVYSVYEVSNGDFNRTIGQDWTTKAAPNKHTIAFWKGWSTLTVRQRGGKENLG